MQRDSIGACVVYLKGTLKLRPSSASTIASFSLHVMAQLKIRRKAIKTKSRKDSEGKIKRSGNETVENGESHQGIEERGKIL